MLIIIPTPCWVSPVLILMARIITPPAVHMKTLSGMRYFLVTIKLINEGEPLENI